MPVPAAARLSGPSLAGRIAVLLVGLLVALAAVAATAYPPLSGRVVDAAGLLPAAARDRLTAKLDGLEAKSGIQLVVATVPSLDGQEIEPYANGLFRAWKLGEAKKNNGALLLIAPKERRVRIEVGYGLEGTLTDALSKIIITNAIVPRFKTGDFAGGIERGVDDIVTVLSTDTSDWQKRPEFRDQPADDGSVDTMTLVVLGIVFLMVFLFLSRRFGRGGFTGGGPVILLPPGPSSWGGGGGGWGGGFGGGGGDGGGFSGGGGSSGGGGASGGW